MRKKIWPYIAFGACALFLLFLLFGRRAAGAFRLTFSALLIAYFLEPLVLKLEKKMGRTPAMAVSYVACILAFALSVFLIILPALSEIRNFHIYAMGAVNGLRTLISNAESMLASKGIRISLSGLLSENMLEYAKKAGEFVFAGAGSAAGFMANALAAAALSWFFLADFDKLSIRLFLLVPMGIRPKVLSAVKSVRRDLGGYVRAQGILIVLIGCITVGVLFLTGTPMPVSLGVMYAFLNAVPYIGPLIGIIPPTLVSLSVSPVRALYTACALLFIQQIDNYVLSPRIMGAASGSGPASVILALSAGGALFGAMGMFLALPVLVSCKAVYRAFTAPAPGMHTNITKGN